MNSLMLLKVGARGEGLFADIAHIRAVPSVDTLMSDQVADLREGFCAPVELAEVGRLLVMDTFMLLKGRVLNKSLIAFRAININNLKITIHKAFHRCVGGYAP